MELKKLNQNFEILKKYTPYIKENFCNYSIGVLYMWQGAEDYEYLEVNDTLILRLTNHKKQKVFLYPIGKDIDGALNVIWEIGKAEGGATIMAVSDNTVMELIEKFPCLSVSSNRDWADYIYNANDLMEYKGKHYNGQRNFYNRFKKKYPNYKYKIIEKRDIARLKEFVKKLDINAPENSLKLEEYKKNYDMLDGMFEVGCVGGYIEVDNKIVAFCVGEIIGNTFYDHIEKGDKTYEGVYQTLVKETATAFCKGVKYINREEDCGDIGLRISKMQYRPVEIKNKNTVKIGTAFCKVKPPVVILTKDLVIREFNENDAEDYYKLSTDIELNKFWGYDYRDDYKGVPPLDYFINGVKELIARHEEYPLCITLNGKIIGEVTMHNFDQKNRAEVGVRILPEYQNKGYGSQAIKCLTDYLIDIVGVSAVKAKCFLENTPSKKMFEKLGFKLVKKDEKYYHFLKECI